MSDTHGNDPDKLSWKLFIAVVAGAAAFIIAAVIFAP